MMLRNYMYLLNASVSISIFHFIDTLDPVVGYGLQQYTCYDYSSSILCPCMHNLQITKLSS